MQTPVIILTHDGANPLGIARSLGRHGIPVYVLTPDRQTSVSWSRYVKKVLTVSSWNNKVEIRERLEDFLREVGSQSDKPILIVTNESHYLDIESLKEFVNEYFNSLTPLEKTIPLSVKDRQFPLAAQAGFRVMESRTLRNVDDLKHIEGNLAFPVLVRPLSNNLRGQFTQKAALYESIETLRENISSILTAGGAELIAQEYIPGSDRDVVFFMASCDEAGEPRIWLAGRKIRQNPPQMGLMSAGVIDPSPDATFVEKCFNLCRLFQLRGFIGIEAKIHADTKEYCYIESSVRIEGNSSIGFAANIDLVWDCYLAAIGKPLTKPGEDYVPDKVRVGSWADMELELGTFKELWRSGNPAWKDFFKWLPRPVAWAYFTWDDPMPWVWHTLRLLSRRMKAIFTKRRL